MELKIGTKIIKTKAGNGSPYTIGKVSTITWEDRGDFKLDNESGMFSRDYLEENWEIVKERIMPKYKVGDKVIVKKDLSPKNSYKGNTVVENMVKLAGKVVTISSVSPLNSNYTIKEDCWGWAEDMFEGLAEEGFKKGDKVFSPFYGGGVVTGRAGDEGYVYVDFETEIGNMYDKLTGKRHPRCGKDTIYLKGASMIKLVYATFKHTEDKQYTFLVPDGVTLKIGDKVFVETKYGERIATCSTDSFEVPLLSAQNIAKGQGIDFSALKPVKARAVEIIKYEPKSF